MKLVVLLFNLFVWYKQKTLSEAKEFNEYYIKTFKKGNPKCVKNS
jgi:hypothetical protein